MKKKLGPPKGYIPKNLSHLWEKKHPSWKGPDVGYSALHDWVERRNGKPDTCEYCGKSGLIGHQIHWANKSQEYKRELTDWLRLCASCHKKYDSFL